MGYKILVIIPAYNEQEAIGETIKAVKACRTDIDIAVINDGSSDNTFQVALNEGVQVLNLPYNLGIGGAMQTGYLYALENGYDFAIQVDADGQHDPNYIDTVLNPVIDGSCDMCIGSRYVEKSAYKSSIMRRIGMIFFSYLIYLITGQKIKDTTSGFRAVNKKVIKFFAKHYPSDYPEVEVLVSLYKNKFKISEVSVEMKNRQGGCSSITPLHSIFYMIKVSMAIFINSIRLGGEQW